MTERELREAVRRRYSARCGYCGVHETEVGAELELDHFRPRSVGGSDDLDNLVYCCPACNRNKGDFWPSSDPEVAVPRLLYPLRDDRLRHYRQEADGALAALTPSGAFHIERLRLNRPQFVARRLRQLSIEQIAAVVATTRQDVTLLRQHIGELERAIDTMQLLLERLVRP